MQIAEVSGSLRHRTLKTETLTDTFKKRGRLQALKIVERVKGIGPSLFAWEAGGMGTAKIMAYSKKSLGIDKKMALGMLRHQPQRGWCLSIPRAKIAVDDSVNSTYSPRIPPKAVSRPNHPGRAEPLGVLLSGGKSCPQLYWLTAPTS